VALLRCDFLESKHRISQAVADAVRSALAESELPLKVVSNLPYSISSPAVVNLLEWDLEPACMCLTLQREVAERMAARPGTKQYGSLTVGVDYWATVEELFALPPGAFWPRPDVSSVVVKIVRRRDRQRSAGYELFARTVRRLFTSRRKTVARALRMAWDRETARSIIASVGLEPATRVEQLTTEQFEAIAECAPGPPTG